MENLQGTIEKLCDLPHLKEIESKTPEPMSSSNKDKQMIWGIGLLVVAGILDLLLKNESAKGTLKNEGTVIGFVVIFLLGILVFFLIRKRELDVIKKQNREIDEKNLEIQRRNIIRKARIDKKVKFLSEQKAEISSGYAQLQRNLRSMYAKDIIHPKYRNLIAICSMYEYFDTGRCTTLTGHEGAYNIFENEIRLNLIINKMDLVIKNLEQLRENQYELFCVMSESNRVLSSINKNLDSISAVANDIAESAALTEYNSRIAAKNTEVLKWIEIYDHM